MCPLAPTPSVDHFEDSRLLSEMEQTLRRGMDSPRAEYNKKTIEEHKLEIQEILGVINPQSLPSCGNLSVIGNSTPVVHAVSGGTTTASVAESGTP